MEMNSDKGIHQRTMSAGGTVFKTMCRQSNFWSAKVPKTKQQLYFMINNFDN